MADLPTSNEHRLLQVFISPRGAGVFETYIHLGTSDLHCTCPGYRLRRHCKHVEFVGERIHEEGGYGISLVSKNAPDLTPEIASDPERFREWVIDNMRVLVL